MIISCDHKQSKSISASWLWCPNCGAIRRHEKSSRWILPSYDSVIAVVPTEPDPYPVGSAVVDDEAAWRRLDGMRHRDRIRDAKMFGGKRT